MWVRGLKRLLNLQKLVQLAVAPYVGAWIETKNLYIIGHAKNVAPYVGAWIETKVAAVILFAFFCRTLCGCVD